MADKRHYVVDIHVRRVDVTEESRNTYNTVTVPGTRSVSTIAHVVVSASSLEDLKSKTAAHIDLVADGGEITTA